MVRILQIQDGLAVGEWNGSGALPVEPDASWIFIDVTNRPDAKLGMLYDVSTDTFTEAPIPGRRILTRHEFLSRFTMQEEIALEMTANTPDNTGAGIRVFQRRLMAAQEIDLDHPSVTLGLQQCASILIALGVWDEATAAIRLIELQASA